MDCQPPPTLASSPLPLSTYLVPPHMMPSKKKKKEPFLIVVRLIGNVLRTHSVLQLSLRTPPNVDAALAGEYLKELFEKVYIYSLSKKKKNKTKQNKQKNTHIHTVFLQMYAVRWSNIIFLLCNFHSIGSSLWRQSDLPSRQRRLRYFLL